MVDTYPAIAEVLLIDVRELLDPMPEGRADEPAKEMGRALRFQRLEMEAVELM